MPRVLVIDGHPNPESLTAAMAQSYAAGNGTARLLALRDLDFDVHMRFGYRSRMAIEPDLTEARQALHDAQHIVIAAPMWWGSVPALLKGFFDRALLPHEEYEMTPLGLPRGLLRGRSGRLLLTTDTPAIALPFSGTPAAAQVARRTMRFCGVRPFRVHRFMGVNKASEARIAGWISAASHLGATDARRIPSPELVAA
ncbi:NAD(P)H-dependent oxidoreductase [Leucobacter viscericola]|uniref:NAD(P)H-dependent oxidoreductase n=1 Tax=Leucobacter viscericola TaxID=2714935 RepID=A0A6G7XF86_9MICO|nr:NAD(P)H-dependent oxidoreductase [Leucobacter viscericola]QIK63213.1 NAD(P)H-dependent oxidoreductase [Leucobacter viscericola]